MRRSGRLFRSPLLLMFTTFLLLFILTACGGSPNADTPTSQETESITTEQEQPAEEGHADEEHEHADEAVSIEALIAALTPIAAGETPNVVATTNIVGDVVGKVGGDNIALTTLMPVGADPHSFEPTPQEVGAIANADIVFVNGMNLEEALLDVIANSGIAPERIIPVSTGIETIEFGSGHDHADEEHADEEHADEEHADEEHAQTDAMAPSEAETDHEHGGVDPHTWMSPLNVVVWTNNIAAALSALDPANTAAYSANAAAYTGELEELDAWIRAQITQIPEENRELVTDHTAFGYYARTYSLEQIGAIVPAYSTLAETSAQELADLQAAIAAFEVPAIFVGVTVNPALAEQVAADTGVQLLPVYTGSLSDANSPAPDYIELMRYNTEQFVKGLTR